MTAIQTTVGGLEISKSINADDYNGNAIVFSEIGFDQAIIKYDTINSGVVVLNQPIEIYPTVDSAIITKKLLEKRLTSYKPNINVRATSTTGITLTRNTTARLSGSSSGLILDGVTLSYSDLVLIKDQTIKSQNGIYEFTPSISGGATYFTLNAVKFVGYPDTIVTVQEGILNKDSLFINTNNDIIMNPPTMVFVARNANPITEIDYYGGDISLPSDYFVEIALSTNLPAVRYTVSNIYRTSATYGYLTIENGVPSGSVGQTFSAATLYKVIYPGVSDIDFVKVAPYVLNAGSGISLISGAAGVTITSTGGGGGSTYAAGVGVAISAGKTISIGQTVATTSDVTFNSIKINGSTGIQGFGVGSPLFYRNASSHYFYNTLEIGPSTGASGADSLPLKFNYVDTLDNSQTYNIYTDLNGYLNIGNLYNIPSLYHDINHEAPHDYNDRSGIYFNLLDTPNTYAIPTNGNSTRIVVAGDTNELVFEGAYDGFGGFNTLAPTHPNWAPTNPAALIPRGYADTKITNNPIINGNFDIWQRGTGFTLAGSTTSMYTADRWKVYSTNGGATVTVSRAGSDDTVNVLKSSNYLMRIEKVLNNGATFPIYALQPFELQESRALRGETITFSLILRGDKSSDGVNYTSGFHTGDVVEIGLLVNNNNQLNNTIFIDANTYAAGSLSITYGTDNRLNDYTLFSVTANIADDVDQIIPYIRFSNLGTNKTQAKRLSVACAQINIGVPLPIQYVPLSAKEELQRCLRYYEKTYELNSPPGFVGNNGAFSFFIPSGMAFNSNTRIYAGAHPRFTIEKRVNPTLYFYSPSGVGGADSTAGTFSYKTQPGAATDAGIRSANISSKGFYMNARGNFASLNANNNAYGELHWVADSEI
jgi:hypothetical protein